MLAINETNKANAGLAVPAANAQLRHALLGMDDK
jgi:hypothetical protein